MHLLGIILKFIRMVSPPLGGRGVKRVFCSENASVSSESIPATVEKFSFFILYLTIVREVMKGTY